MRLIADLFPCQTVFRHRGISRYTQALTRAMAVQRGDHEMLVLADPMQPESLEDLRRQFIRLLPAGSFLPYYHESVAGLPADKLEPYSRLAGALIEQAYQFLQPDMILSPSLFEDAGHQEHGLVPLPPSSSHGAGRAAILYDLIPYIFHEQYLDPNPQVKDWYLSRLDALHRFDLLLAISESTRQDAIRMLGLDPDRVVNILGAATSHFRKLDFTADERLAWLRHLGISRPYVLYIGGDDFRKNMRGALRAFARLPRKLSSTHQLVLNDVGNQEVFRSLARSLGLADADLVILPRPSDAELEVLYNLCRLFIFPSLYEGFGLPILEAMSCGAPALASNNSSLPEVLGRSDALFDASSDEAVAAAIAHALTDEGFRSELARYGPGRAAEFTWERSARLTWAALEDRHAARRATYSLPAAPAGPPADLRIAYVSPMPPQKSGVAEYSAALLPVLADLVRVDLFVEPGLQLSDVHLGQRLAVRPWTELPSRRDDFDAVVYHMGNSEFHIGILDLLQEIPGIVVNHDFFASGLAYVKEYVHGVPGAFVDAMEYSHGLRSVADYLRLGAEPAIRAWPMNWRVLRYAQQLVVHSPHQERLLDDYFGHGWYPRPTVIKQLRGVVDDLPAAPRKSLRKELGLPADAFIFCSLGLMAPTKLNNLTIEAFAQVKTPEHEKTILVFVGPLDGGAYGQESLRLIDQLGLKRRVIITGYKYQQEYEKYLACSDAAIQLRTGSRGETSRAVLDCLAFGLPTVINAHGSLNDYPDSAAVKLPETPHLQDLVSALDRIRSDPDYRLEKRRGARAYMTAEHDPRKLAAAYVEVIRRSIEGREDHLLAPAASALKELDRPLGLIQSTAGNAARNLTLRSQPRILLTIDGLEEPSLPEDDRLAAEHLIASFLALPDRGVHVEVVRPFDEGLVSARRLAERMLDFADGALGGDDPLPTNPGDVLVLLSALLPWCSPIPNAIRDLRLAGGRLLTIVDGDPSRITDSPAVDSDMILCASRPLAVQVQDCLNQVGANDHQAPDVLYPSNETDGPIGGSELALWMLDPARNPGLFTLMPKPEAAPPLQVAEPVVAVPETVTPGEADGIADSEANESARAAQELELLAGGVEVNELAAPDDLADLEQPALLDADRDLGEFDGLEELEELEQQQELEEFDGPDAAAQPEPSAAAEELQEPEDAVVDYVEPPAPGDGLLVSCPCSQSLLESDVFQEWVRRMGEKGLHMHRKLWEWSYIAQALYERGLLRPGSRGLGFAVGQEPLAALFASLGCEIVATDLELEQAKSRDGNWVATDQHAATLDDLNKRGICPDDEFRRLVSFRPVDMASIPTDLHGFDFVWSSCSFEHLGSLSAGKQFVYNSLNCLRPGGVAVHTTEYNLSSNAATVDRGGTVLYRRKDFEGLARNLRAQGHQIYLDFTDADGPYDRLVDWMWYTHEYHLRLETTGYICTSYGLIITTKP